MAACGADERIATRTANEVAAGKPSTGADGKPGDDGVAGWRYLLAPDRALRHLDVRACFDRKPVALTQEESRAVRVFGAPGPGLSLRGRRLDVSAVDREGCVGYRVDLSRVALAEHPLATRAGDDVLLGAPLWLWGPEPLARRGIGDVRAIRNGVDVVTPWARTDTGWVLDPVSFVFDAPVVFGSPAVSDLRLRTGTLQVVRLGDVETPSERVIHEWLEQSASATATLFGKLPVPQATVVIVPVEEASVPVSVGHAYRGGGASIVLRVSRHARRDELLRDWVAIHEMVHLGLPYVRHRDAWLSEGITTYYQEVLRARAGSQTPLAAWRSLRDGMDRARRKGDALTLREEALLLDGIHGVDRVYWAGASIALLVDVELRRRGLGSLDELVRRLSACCAWPPRDWSAQALVARMDAMIGEPIVSRIAERWLASVRLPSLRSTWRWLGLHRTGDGRLVASPRAPGAHVRDAILSPDGQ